MKDLILPPSYGNRLIFPKLIIFREGAEGRPPIYFITSGRNFEKFATEERRKDGFKIVGHVKEENDAKLICRELNQELRGGKKRRPRYQVATTKTHVDIRTNKLWIPPKYRN